MTTRLQRSLAQTPQRRFSVRRPVVALLVPAIGVTLVAQTTSLLLGWSVVPAKILELVLLLGGATLLSARAGGWSEVRRLYGGLKRWRIGVPAWILVVAALPLFTVATAVATGTLRHMSTSPLKGVLLYLLFLVFGAVTANLWEETVWSGFVQRRLMGRHGLLVGSLLTAVPFFLIHLPLAFETQGWPGTSWRDAVLTWGILLISAPFFRYLVGMLLVDTGGSLLAAGLLHASFNASGALPVLAGGWQYIPAMITLTLVLAATRRWRRATRQDHPMPHGRGPGSLRAPSSPRSRRHGAPTGSAAEPGSRRAADAQVEP